jgi:hypothetical protein
MFIARLEHFHPSDVCGGLDTCVADEPDCCGFQRCGDIDITSGSDHSDDLGRSVEHCPGYYFSSRINLCARKHDDEPCLIVNCYGCFVHSYHNNTRHDIRAGLDISGDVHYPFIVFHPLYLICFIYHDRRACHDFGTYLDTDYCPGRSFLHLGRRLVRFFSGDHLQYDGRLRQHDRFEGELVPFQHRSHRWIGSAQFG